MPWPSESRCRFVVATDSRIIHATGMRRRQACARAGRGLLACFCGVRIRLPQQPPQRIVPGWHHYCPECLCFLIAASDRPLASPLNTYEPWLCELAALEGDEPDTDGPDAEVFSFSRHMWVASVYESRWHAYLSWRVVGAWPVGCVGTCVVGGRFMVGSRRVLSASGGVVRVSRVRTCWGICPRRWGGGVFAR